LSFAIFSAKYHFDLVIGDEAYEIITAMYKKQVKMENSMVMIEDFIGLQAMTINPLEKIAAYLSSRSMALQLRFLSDRLIRLFVGEPEDIPHKRFGFLLPNKRDFAHRYYQFLGYIIRFDPDQYADKDQIKVKLGYGKNLSSSVLRAVRLRESISHHEKEYTRSAYGLCLRGAVWKKITSTIIWCGASQLYP